MRKIALSAVMAVAVATPVAAQAQDKSGIYLGIAGGVNLLDETNIDILNGAATVENDYEAGYAVSGTVGYDYGRLWKYGGLRSELEFAYRENDIDVHQLGGANLPGSRGDAVTYSLMLNGFHDFQTGTLFRPYVGAGLGYAWSEVNDFGVTGLNVANDDDSDFAWQFIVGIGYDITDNATLAVDYRYFDTAADIRTTPATGSTSNDVDLESHTISLGLRYKF